MSNDFPFNHFINIDKFSKTSAPKDPNIKDYDIIKNALGVEVKPEQPVKKQTVSDDNFSTSELQSLSEAILEGLKEVVNPQKYKAFFANSFAVKDLTDSKVIITVTNSFIEKVIKNNYLDNIKEILFNFLGTKYEIEFQILGSSVTKPVISDSYEADLDNKRSVTTTSFKLDEDSLSTNQEIQDEVDSTYLKYNNSTRSEARFDKSKKFSNFVVGPSNNMAYAFTLAIAKDPGVVYPQLYIFGNSGLGKTHLLHALCNQIFETKPHLRVCFTNANEFMSEMVLSIQSNKIAEFRRKYTELVDVLIIDDIHELKNKTRTQSEFFFIFNQLQSKGKQLVFTSDKQPKDITGIEDRIRTRLSSALLIDIQQPDLETRIAILKKKAIEKDIYLEDEVINLIASCVKTNVRELEGNLVKLGAYSDLMKVDIDLEIAKKQLKLSEDDDHKVITVESITKAVSGYYKIPMGDIRGKTRKKEVAMARHISMFMCHKILKKTLEEIGEFFENRDHSTVIHGIKKIQNLVKDDTKLSHTIYEIESRL